MPITADSEYTEAGAHSNGARKEALECRRDGTGECARCGEALAELPSKKTWISSIYHRNNAEMISANSTRRKPQCCPWMQFLEFQEHKVWIS